MRRGPAVILLLCLLVAAAYGAQRAATEGWARVTEFSPSSLRTALPATGSPPLANRVVLIMVDGLRPDDPTLLPTLDWLRRKGAAYRLTVPAPNYQVPLAATLLTGARPETHGVLLPTVPGPLRADSLTAAAGRARVTAAGVGTPALGKLLGPTVVTWHTAGTPAELLENARTLLGAKGPRLVLIQMDQFHTESHTLKAFVRDTPKFIELLGELDAQLVRMLELVDLKTTALVVVGALPTDHAGTHTPGASVPLIMAGAGIREGARGDASMMDVAPTLAAVLGLPTPLQSQGQPIMAALQADGRPGDVIAQRYLAARKSFVDAALLTLGSTDITPDPPTSVTDDAAYGQTLEQHLRTARFAWWKASVLQRLPYVGGALLFLLLYLVVTLRQPFGFAVFMGTLTYGAVFHMIFFLNGGRYSAGMPGLESLDLSLAFSLGLKAAASMSVAAVVTGFFLSRRSFRRRAYIASTSLHMALSTAAIIALPVTAGLLFVGWEFPVELPAPPMLVWFFLSALQVSVIGYLSPLWAILTIMANRLSRRFWPVKEVGDPVRNADKVVRLKALRRHVKSELRG